MRVHGVVLSVEYEGKNFSTAVSIDDEATCKALVRVLSDAAGTTLAEAATLEVSK